MGESDYQERLFGKVAEEIFASDGAAPVGKTLYFSITVSDAENVNTSRTHIYKALAVFARTIY